MTITDKDYQHPLCTIFRLNYIEVRGEIFKIDTIFSKKKQFIFSGNQFAKNVKMQQMDTPEKTCLWGF